MPRETNGFGDIYGGWLVSQMDLAGTAMASKVAGGRVATVAIDRMAFLVPVAVGAQLSFYTQALEIGRSSIQMLVEVWSDDPLSSEWRKGHRGGVRVRRHRRQRPHPPGPATPRLSWRPLPSPQPSPGGRGHSANIRQPRWLLPSPGRGAGERARQARQNAHPLAFPANWHQIHRDFRETRHEPGTD